MSDNIIVFPEYKKLKEQLKLLQTELSMLMLERDELRFVICKNIETVYMLKLGGLEYRAYKAQCEFLRLKRKLELIQAKINRQEKVNLTAIETQLNEEFLEYQKRLEEQLNKMNEAIKRSKFEQLTEEENTELKTLYRKIVKALHPDINPDVTEAQAELFNNAVEAYKNGELNTIRAISETLGDVNGNYDGSDAISELKKTVDRLLILTKSIQREISKIKSEFPYIMKELVNNEEQINDRKLELEEIIEEYNDWIAYYKERIEEVTNRE